MRRSWTKDVLDAALVTLLSTGLALLTNSLRPSNSIALVAKNDYETLVPCPEYQGRPARPLAAGQIDLNRPGVALVDAREQAEFAQWHPSGAISIPFDYLEPKPEERRILKTRARKVIVYGDGGNPDAGKQLANAISGKGVKNVFYVTGGAPALRAKAGRQ